MDEKQAKQLSDALKRAPLNRSSVAHGLWAISLSIDNLADAIRSLDPDVREERKRIQAQENRERTRLAIEAVRREDGSVRVNDLNDLMEYLECSHGGVSKKLKAIG